MQSILPYATEVLSFAARLVVTLLLIFAILLLTREVRRLWSRTPISLGEVQFIENGEASEAKGKGIASEIIDRRNAIKSTVAKLIAASKAQRDTGESTTAQVAVDYTQIFTEEELENLESAADAVPEIELKIQGNDIGSTIANLRRWVVPANVAKIRAFKRDEGTEFSIDWPTKHAPSNRRHYEIALRGSVIANADLGQTIACRILWIELARNAEKVAQTHPDVFCRWSKARRILDFAEAELSATGLSDKRKTELKAAADSLKDIAERVGGFVPLQNIYALLLEKSGAASDAEITHAQANVVRVISNEAPVPYKASETAIRATLASADDAQIVPGKTVRVGTSVGVVQARVTAIVQDASGAQLLVMPDYAFVTGGSEDVYASVSIDGKPDLLLIGSRIQRATDYPMALVALAEGIKVANIAYGEKISRTGSAELGMTVRLVGETELHEAEVTAIQVSSNIGGGDGFNAINGLIETAKFPGRGNGGAPVLDPTGGLIGMLYAGSQSVSLTLPLVDAFARLNLTLIP